MIHILKYIFISLLIFSSTSSFSQNVIARLDLGKKDPKPDYYEYSPVDGGLITFGATSKARLIFSVQIVAARP